MSTTPSPYTPKYCFWRTPEGRPHREPNTKFALDELLAEWGRASRVDAQGNVSLQGFASIQIEAALKLAFVVVEPGDAELDDHDAWGIANHALRHVAFANGGSKPIANLDFIREADKRAATFFRQTKRKFVFVTSLSVAKFPAKAITISGCKIRQLSSRKKFRPPAFVVSTQVASIYRTHVESTRYCWIAVDTEGRTTSEAFNRAFEAVGLLRSLWTLVATSGMSSISFGSGPTQPLSAVHTGPVHTLHEPSGKPVSEDFFWQDDDPRPDRRLFAPTNGWVPIEKMRKRILRKIASLPYREDLVPLLQRYGSALDLTNHDLLLLQVWSVLERAMNSVGIRYDDVIKMATWFMADRPLVKQLLECIRLQRNRFVHSSQNASQSEQIGYLVKSILEKHLWALIGNRFKVASLAEYAELLSQPVDPSALHKRRRHLTHAFDLHVPPPTKPGASTTPPSRSPPTAPNPITPAPP